MSIVKRCKHLRGLVAVPLLVLFPIYGVAADYYVSANGNAAWPNCTSTSPCSLSTVNTNIVAGGRALLKAGTYATAVLPTNNGASDTNRIIFQAAGDGNVILTQFSGSSTEYGAINLARKSYVSVVGRADTDPIDTRRIILQPPGPTTVTSLISFCGGTGNIVENIQAQCTDTRPCNYGVNFCIHSWGSQLTSRFNILRRSHITGNSTDSVSTGVEDLVNIGGTAQYNLIEDNIFDGAVRHITFNNQAPNGSFNVSRGNIISNGAHTAQAIYNGGPNHLVENSRLQGHAQTVTCVGPECNFGSSFQIGTSDLLFRYNTLFEGCRAPCTYDSQGGIGGGYGADNTMLILNYRIYNNTIVDSAGVPFGVADWSNISGHHVGDGVLINNFLYDGSGEIDDIDVSYRSTISNVNDRFISNVLGNPGGISTESVIHSNNGSNYSLANAKTALSNPSGPSFVDWNGFQNVFDASPGFTDYAANDFTLPAANKYIDKGSPLTQVGVGDSCNGGSSCSTALVVNDSRFFYNAGGFPGWMNVQWDWIAVGPNANDITTAMKVQITGVDYGTKTLTLSQPVKRNDNDFVWLWKDSAGRQVVVGTKPDIGAFEYGVTGSNPPPAAPKNVHIGP